MENWEWILMKTEDLLFFVLNLRLWWLYDFEWIYVVRVIEVVIIKRVKKWVGLV